MGTLRLGNEVVVPSVVAKELVNKQKFGASIDNFLGDINSEGVYSVPAEVFDFAADGIKSIGTEAFYYAFARKPIKTALFPALTTISGSDACNSMFSGCTSLTSAAFPVLTTISGINAYYFIFSGCTSLMSVTFPALTMISGNSACTYTFYNCSSLTLASFPALTTILGSNVCYFMFGYCYNLTSASFPALTTVEHTTCMPANMFQGCRKLTEMHFRKDAQTIIEGQSGYTSKFGATNATIYFDL